LAAVVGTDPGGGAEELVAAAPRKSRAPTETQLFLVAEGASASSKTLLCDGRAQCCLRDASQAV
jgi:hypothetical protein